ncbi:MAG: nucleotide sugar dehydrogenase [Candidatus Omnitrophica bacterium]|nr:nucleotide sugar dehydrogenase [Candidatus Omnitrophota bacterium]
MPSAYEQLAARIRRREATVAVVGLGYVGLPLATAFSEAGFPVIGLDRDARRLQLLRAGRSYVSDLSHQTIRAFIKRPTTVITDRPASLRRADAVIVCVPTPLLKTREPDLSYVVGAMRAVARAARPPALVVLESTTYPGTTDGVVRATIEEAGHRLDAQVFLAFSPERIDPGNSRFATRNIPKLVGGVTPRATRLAAQLYGQVLDRVIAVSSSRVAETAKLLENTFRLVNIGLANEFALLCRALDIDVWEVIEAASTKPFGFMPFYPGPGIGGHCIPSDPIYLSWRARAAGAEARLIDLAAQINTSMPQYVVHRVGEALNARGRAVKGASLLVVGVAYKRDTNDTRESPALEIMEVLARKGAAVSYHDPLVPVITVCGARRRSRALTPSVIRAADCVVIVTDHSAIDYRRLGREAAMILDTRNVMRRAGRVRAAVERL